MTGRRRSEFESGQRSVLFRWLAAATVILVGVVVVQSARSGQSGTAGPNGIRCPAAHAVALPIGQGNLLLSIGEEGRATIVCSYFRQSDVDTLGLEALKSDPSVRPFVITIYRYAAADPAVKVLSRLTESQKQVSRRIAVAVPNGDAWATTDGSVGWIVARDSSTFELVSIAAADGLPTDQILAEDLTELIALVGPSR